MSRPRRVGRSLKPFRRPALWAGLWMLAVACVVVASLVPARDLPDLQVSDKSEHLVAYALLAAGAVQLFARRLSWAVVCVLLVLMGIGLEYLQAAMKLGRMLDRADALANTLGVLIGLATAFTPLRDLRPADPPPILCLIGRVVPIKDIKTFIRAMRRVANNMPEAEGWIAGPEDEDPGYAQECHDLVRSLGLENNVRFLGFQKIDDLMPKIGLTILSSISEALPLVILEGYAAGVPTISTDVGSCRQLIEGLPGDDAAIGPSGAVVNIADPQALADASIALLSDYDRWRAASRAAIERVERYYTDTMMFGAYRKVFEGALDRAPEPR